MTQESNSASASILLFGEDEPLVRTRGWVLEKAGYKLRTAMDLGGLIEIGSKERIDLFLLCDSLSSESRAQALNILHVNWPQARRLVLANYAVAPEASSAEVIVPAEAGPRKLLAEIHKQMATLSSPF